MAWHNLENMTPTDFVCGFCNADVCSEKGYKDPHEFGNILICHRCGRPNYIFDDNGSTRQVPGAPFGNPVSNVSDENVNRIYAEARRCMSVGSYTAAVLCCRKLLMNIAVSKGASKGENFASYVSYLFDNNHISQDSKDWVDHIREIGNIATHEIEIMDEGSAKNLISFCEVLLKTMFEFPAIAREYTGK